MPNTPRLCIDGRIAGEIPRLGHVAEELIDQLVSANGEEEVSEWIAKHRTVLLSHPGQVFSGQLKRFETRRKIGRSPLYWIWEKNFVKDSGVSLFHRFRPIDQISTSPAIATLTTVLPAKGSLPFFLSRKGLQHFVVSADRYRKTLVTNFQVPEEQVSVVRPSVRRFVHFTERKASPDGWVLFLVSPRENSKHLKRLVQIVAEQYPDLPRKTIVLKGKSGIPTGEWIKTLAKTKLCFYLSSQDFDWPTLALETFYYGVPTVFSDQNAALAELLPNSPLSLSHFLVNQPALKQLVEMTQVAQGLLSEQTIFHPLSMARQYRDVYQNFQA